MKATQALGIITGALLAATWSAQVPAQAGIVGSVVKAPVAADGDVAGAPTDVVINFAMDMDPTVAGRVLRKGESIRVALPKAFRYNNGESYPVRDLFSAADCKPGLLKCSTGVMLQGWPQNPVLPSAPPGKEAQYSLSLDKESNAITYKAEKDIDGVPLPGPGIKQMHLLLFGFSNPEQPGVYPLRISVHDAAGKETESGVGFLSIRERIAPSINVSSVFVPGDVNGGAPPNPSTIYQKTQAGTPAPMPWDFLVWDGNGKAFEGIEVVQEDDAGGRLVHDGKQVGRFAFSTPAGATGQSVTGGASISLPSTPVIGKTFGDPVPVGRLTTQFTAGSAPGRYYTTFTLTGGNSVTMVVDVAGS